jgi:ComF family protein
MPWIDNCVKNALALLYNLQCVICAAPASQGMGLCDGCAADLPRWPRQCPRCGRPYQGIGGCGKCQHAQPAFDLTIAPLRYATPVDRLIHEFKYQRQFRHAHMLGHLLAREVAHHVARTPDLIIPVPLHKFRLRERGFNQSLELAKPIARRLNVPIDHSCVVRIRATPPQAGMPPGQRQRNVRNAFALRRPMIAGHVAIVDDVMTSGHTVNQLARCLRAAGVRHIQVWTLARA